MRANRTVFLEGVAVTVKDKMLSYIGGRDGGGSERRVFTDRDFAEMGDSDQVSSCLNELISEGVLFEVSDGGVYTKKKYENPHDYLFDVDDDVPLGLPYTLRGRLVIDAGLYEKLASWSDAQDLSGAGVHPVATGYRLLRLDNRLAHPGATVFEIALLCDESAEVVYYNRAFLCDFGAKQAAIGLRWQTPEQQHRAATQGITDNVISYLARHYTVIVSAGSSTQGGPFFLEAQASAAIRRGNAVQAYQRAERRALPLCTRDDLQQLKSRIWGTPGGFSDTFIMIDDGAAHEPSCSMPLALIDELDAADITKMAGLGCA